MVQGRHPNRVFLIALVAIVTTWSIIIIRVHYSSYFNTIGDFIPDYPTFIEYDEATLYHNNSPLRRNNDSNTINLLNDSNDDNKVCKAIASSLLPSSWSDIVYHKDRAGMTGDPNPNAFDDGKFSSVEEDNEQARSTIHEFNILRHEVLNEQLLNVGVRSTGRIHPARAFAKHLKSLLDGEQHQQQQQQRRLIIAVFGNSFTIGSNCGESSVQSGEDCAWPMRLSRRFDELFQQRGGGGGNSSSSSSLVEWRMYQENAQGSANIAQRIPSLIDEYNNRNVTPDVILLDNTIGDQMYGIARPWFEAVVRAFIDAFPDTVLVSMVSAIPAMVNVSGNNQYDTKFPPWLHEVQNHYGLAVVDFAMMVQHLRLHNNNDIGVNHGTAIQRSIKEYQQRRQQLTYHYASIPPNEEEILFTSTYTNSNNTIVDILWPQSDEMISINGKIFRDMIDGDVDDGGVYWLNYLPLTRKTKPAWYPQNHPPWSTHQYVADTVMYALLQIVNVGLGCADGQGIDVVADDDDDGGDDDYSFMDETVSPSDKLDDCFICRTPLTKMDAKSPQYIDGQLMTNLLDDDYDGTINPITVTCGDWKWITDKRKRSGWQSDQRGSLIVFRLQIGNNTQLPTMSLTYMKSHQTFGNLMVTFRPVSKKDAKLMSSLLGCDDVERFRDLGWEGDFDIGGKFANDSTIIPSLLIEGWIPQYSLWETIVFPPDIDYHNVNVEQQFKLLQKTLSKYWKLSALDGDSRTFMEFKDDENRFDDDIVEYIDLYVMNPEDSRVKIQVVTAC
jgi:hypothetical protein